MEYASEAYRNAMKENVRGKSYVWISLDLVNIYAQETAYISSSFSGSEDNLYNDAAADEGVTSIENDGSITFTFGEFTTLLLSGVRFTLGNASLPSTITITNGTTSKTVAVTSSTMTIDNVFENCSYLKLTPSDGDLNIKKISFGSILEFDNTLIMNTSRSNTVKRINDELPLKQFSFTVHNYDRLWNKDNPNSYSRFLMEKQKVSYKYGRELGENDIYEINGGIVYLTEWNSDDYSASFSCTGRLDYVNSEYTLGRFYPDGITLYQLAEFVLQDAGITLYELDAVLRTFTVYNPLPVDTHKACLQMIAHAGRCILYEDRNGAVCLKSVDRPEILKTASLTDATNFSNGNDVITTTTTANYGSTEPEYTKADGLHYFYPEENSSEVNYFPYPYVGYAIYKDVEYPFVNNTLTLQGITFTINNDHSISISGQNTGNSYIDCRLVDETNEYVLDNTEYAFGAANNIEDSIGDGNNWNVTAYIKKPGVYVQQGIVSNYPYSRRKITSTNNFILKSVRIIINPGKSCNTTIYPQLIKTNSEEDKPTTNTLPVGFVSEEFAKSDGTFDTTPKITIDFVSLAVLDEVVMNCAVAPKDFNIKVYKGGTLKETRNVTNNTSPLINESFNNISCDKVEITFTKTTAYQRIHVNTVELGAAIEYTLAYHDMTTTPVASSIEKISSMDFELYSYADPSDINAGTGLNTVKVNYSEIENGGLEADITSGGVGAITYIHVEEGANTIDVASPSMISEVVYSDDIEGGTIEIVDSGAYYVKVICSREGDVTVNGIEYIENTTTYSIAVNEIGKPVKISNPLISTKEHAERLKSWFLEYYGNDIEYRLTYRGDPVLDACDSIFIENQFVEDNLVRIESEELSTAAGMSNSNQLIARRVSFREVDVTVLRDFVINPSAMRIDVGESEIISIIKWIPDTALNKTATWSSSDDSVATVEDGVVTGVANGTATISATSNGITHTCEITVS